jgi:dihydropyrimidinase
MQPFDIVIRGGTVATATDTMKADVGIRGTTVAAIAEGLDKGKQRDRRARQAGSAGRRRQPLPHPAALGIGPDQRRHVRERHHGDRRSAAPRRSSRSPAQHVGMSLKTVVDDYHALAERGAVVDYAFHMILADPREDVLEKEVPPLVKAGHASLKVFMTYDRLKVDDEQLLNVLQSARDNRAMVCVHAENHGMISWMGKRLLKHGHTAPKFHGISHPRYCEPEAFNRLIACAALVDQPIMIFHVSTAEGTR